MARNIEMIRPTRSIPIWILVANIEDVISNEVGDTANTNPTVIAEASDRERKEKEVGLLGIICDEMAFEERFLEVTLTSIVAMGLKVLWQQRTCKGIASFVRINIDLEAFVHFFVVFKK